MARTLAHREEDNVRQGAFHWLLINLGWARLERSLDLVLRVIFKVKVRLGSPSPAGLQSGVMALGFEVTSVFIQHRCLCHV